MQFSFIPSAYAAGSSFDMSSFGSFIPIILVCLIFYFLILRPHQKQQAKTRQQQDNLRRGDRIMTAGGIIGVVQNARDKEQEIDVEIAPNVRVKIVRSTIMTVMPKNNNSNTK